LNTLGFSEKLQLEDRQAYTAWPFGCGEYVRAGGFLILGLSIHRVNEKLA
jgi:hypothetical protein